MTERNTDTQLERKGWCKYEKEEERKERKKQQEEDGENRSGQGRRHGRREGEREEGRTFRRWLLGSGWSDGPLAVAAGAAEAEAR